jgi:hypothetical protein
MSVKRTGNNRASRRGMSTDKFPSRKGLLKINKLETGGVEDPQAWTPNWSASGSMTFTPTGTTYARYQRFGNLLYFTLWQTGTTGGTVSDQIIFTLPFEIGKFNLTVNNTPFACQVRDASSGASSAAMADIGAEGGNQVIVRKSGGVNWALGTGRLIIVSGTVELSNESDYYRPTQTVEEIIESSFFDLKPASREFQVSGNAAQGSLADGTFTPINGATLFLPKGSYKIYGNFQPNIGKSTDFTRARAEFQLVDDSSTPISNSYFQSNRVHFPVGAGEATVYTHASPVWILEDWPGGNLTAEIRIFVTGGTGINRIISGFGIFATKISD